MEITSIKIAPPKPSTLESSSPMDKSKVKTAFNPMLMALMDNVKEKGIDKSNQYRISSWDIFGEPVKFNWNKSDSYKTKTGVVFTAIYAIILGFIIWVYFSEFFMCQSPSVFESPSHGPLEPNDPDNDLMAVFPVFSFVDYSRPEPWPKKLPTVPWADVTCHFVLEFAHQTISANKFPTGTPIPLKGDCNAKFKEMYKSHTGIDDETLTSRVDVVCPDTTKLPMTGEGEDCQSDVACSYYTFKMWAQPGSTAHCNAIDKTQFGVNLSQFSHKVSVDDFGNPWGMRVSTEPTVISQTQSQLIDVGWFYTKLQTEARQFGIGGQPVESKKLTQNVLIKVKKLPYHPNVGYININQYPQGKHKEITRSYITFLDAAGNVGGQVDLILIVIGLGYAWYLDQRFKNDVIHKGCMITGKYGVDLTQAEYLNDVYSKKHFELPKFGFISAVVEKFCGWQDCCGGSEDCIPGENDENKCPKDQAKKDDEVLEKAFERILDRQLDMKHVLGLIQDLEIIKRVVFQERHQLLSPLVTIESEKREVRGSDVPVKFNPDGRRLFSFGSEDAEQDMNVPDEEEPKANGGRLSLFAFGGLEQDMNVAGDENLNFDQQRLPKTPSDELPKTPSDEPDSHKLQNQLFGQKVVQVTPRVFPIAGNYEPFPQSISHAGNAESDSQKIEIISKMVLSLQIDLQSERSRREILEEKVKKLENNSTKPSTKKPEDNFPMPSRGSIETDWVDSQKILNGLGSPEMITRFDSPERIKGIDEKMKEFRSEYDLKLRSLNQNLSEMQSVLAKKSGQGPGENKRSLIGVSGEVTQQSEGKDYNRFLYRKLERGGFPRQISLQNAMKISLKELLHKPQSEKTEIETLMDQYYLENLPPTFLRSVEMEHEIDLTKPSGPPKGISLLHKGPSNEFLKP